MNRAESNPTWYLLYAGTSADGRGQPDYVGRTTDINEAKRHLRECRSSPYNTGSVLEVMDKKLRHIWKYDDWGKE